MNFLSEIEAHFEKEYPREGCGLISVQKGKKVWIPCSNVAKGEEDFIIDSNQYIEAMKFGDIIGIVHSHPNTSSTPSAFDIDCCNVMGIPYYIFSYPEMDLTVLEPENTIVDLYGKEYIFGIQDCFEACRQFLKTKNINIKNRAAFEDNWWTKGLNYFSPELIKEWGFNPIDLNNVKELDIIVFQVMEEVPNHCGVYLGDDIFYHHAFNRLSCRENLFPLWNQYIVGAYRYNA
jgi:proteasome lid subunit RPN8/RPN11